MTVPRDGVRLLEEHPAFGRSLDKPGFEAASKQLILPAFTVDPGPVSLSELARSGVVRGRLVGVWVADGTLTMDLRLRQRTASRVIAPPDLLLRDGIAGDALPAEALLHAHTQSRLAALDDRLLIACARWPRLMQGLFEHLAVQHNRLLRNQALSQLPRVEDRLLGLLWTLADERGIARKDGVHVKANLTHEALGHMIGAKRPTVSLGLAALEASGDVQRGPEGFLLSHSSAERFSGGLTSTDLPVDPPAAPLSSMPDVDAPVLLLGRDPLMTETFGVTLAAGEAEALAALDEVTPEVICIVLPLSGTTRPGKQLAQRLRSDPALAHARLLLINSDGEQEPHAALLAATHEYVPQPLDEARLTSRIAAQLALAAATRARREEDVPRSSEQRAS